MSVRSQNELVRLTGEVSVEKWEHSRAAMDWEVRER